MTSPFNEVPSEPEYPDPSLIASIEHQAEKLGYLVKKVEDLFAKRAREARHIALFQHGLENIYILRKWTNGEINDEEAAELQAQLAERTSAMHDEVKDLFTTNMNRLNEIVLRHLDIGKGSASELDNFLNEMFRGE